MWSGRKASEGDLGLAEEYMKDSVFYKEQAVNNASAEINQYGESSRLHKLKEIVFGWFDEGGYMKLADIYRRKGDEEARRDCVRKAVVALDRILEESVVVDEAGEAKFTGRMTIDPFRIFEAAAIKFEIDAENQARHAEAAERIRQARTLNEKTQSITRGEKFTEKEAYRDIYQEKLAELYLEMPAEQFTERDLTDLEIMAKTPGALIKKYLPQRFFAKVREIKKIKDSGVKAG